jgi:hypothetical protein
MATNFSGGRSGVPGEKNLSANPIEKISWPKEAK